MTMGNSVETGILVRNIDDPEVRSLVRSSSSIHRIFRMDIGAASWQSNQSHSRLTFDMQITPEMQGWEGIIHGGITDFILHDVTGFASLLFARQHGRVVLGSRFESSYSRPLPLHTPIQVVAEIEDGAQRDYIFCSGFVKATGSGDEDPIKTYARGSLLVKAVSEIRRP